MLVAVRQFLMRVQVPVPLSHVQSDANGHQQTGGAQLKSDPFAQHRDCDQRAEERRDRKVSAGARGAEIAQTDDE